MGKRMTEWDKLKRMGKDHYKSSSGIEPFDLMKAGGILHDKAIGDIIGYAYRNRRLAGRSVPGTIEDMDKIIHYANVVKALVSETVIIKPTRKRSKLMKQPVTNEVKPDDSKP